MIDKDMSPEMFNRVFRACVIKIYGEMQQGELSKPAAALNNEIKTAFKLK